MRRQSRELRRRCSRISVAIRLSFNIRARGGRAVPRGCEDRQVIGYAAMVMRRYVRNWGVRIHASQGRYRSRRAAAVEGG